MRASLFAAGFLLAALGAASADSRIERTVTWETARPGARPERTNRRETLWIGDGRARADDRVSRESWIVRSDRKAIWRIDHVKKTWSEVTFEEGAKARAARAEDLRAAVARVAGSGDEPALRALMEAFAPSDGAAELKDEGDGGAVAGKATRTVSAQPQGAPGMKGKLAAEAAGLDRIARLFGEAGMLSPRMSEALSKAKGMLLSGTWSLVFPEAIVVETFEVTKFEEAAAPEGTYDVPAGYRKVAAPVAGGTPKCEAAPPGGHEGEPPGREEEEELEGEEAGKDE